METVLEMIGTPAKSSVPRGNPKGKEFGVKLEKRDTQSIHFKSAHQQNDLKKTISSTIENSQEKPNLNEIELILHRLKSEIKTLGLSHSEFIKKFTSYLITRLRKSLDGMLLIQSPIK